MFVSPTGWERTVVVEEVLYTFGVVVLVCVRIRLKSHGALAVSCKYFKQFKWPFMAANIHAHSYIDHTYAQQDIRVCEDDHF